MFFFIFVSHLIISNVFLLFVVSCVFDRMYIYNCLVFLYY